MTQTLIKLSITIRSITLTNSVIYDRCFYGECHGATNSFFDKTDVMIFPDLQQKNGERAKLSHAQKERVEKRVIKCETMEKRWCVKEC